MSSWEENIKEDEIPDLPSGYIYSSFCKLSLDTLQFVCDDLNTETDAQDWVKKFGEQNYVEWRIARTYPKLHGVKCCFKKEYRCQHSASSYRAKSSSVRQSKSANCPSQLHIKRVRQSQYSEFETIICVKNPHNHDTGTTATSLKYRDVGKEAKEKLIRLFSNGHSPSSAHQILKSDALMEYGDDYDSVADDRHQIPDRSYCYNLFYNEFKKEYGSLGRNDRKDHNKLKQKLDHRQGVGERELDEWCDTTGRNSSTEKCNKIKESLKNVFNDILKRVESNESLEIMKASEKFCNNYNLYCKDDNSLQSALCTFGKYRGNKKLSSSTKISVQPTSTARRKIQLQGKHRLNSGRPRKSVVRDVNKDNYTTFGSLPLKRKYNIETIIIQTVP